MAHANQRSVDNRLDDSQELGRHESDDSFGNEGVEAIALKLRRQGNAAKNEKIKIELQKDLSKEKVVRFFESMRDVLAVKENELLANVNLEFNKSFDTINTIIRDITIETTRLQNLEYGDEHTEKNLQQAIMEREDVLKGFAAPVLKLNNDSLQVVKNLCCGEVIQDDIELQNADDTDQSSVVRGEQAETNELNNEDDTAIEPSDTVSRASANNDDVQPDGNSLNETESAAGYSRVHHVLPSAPALPQNVEDPPPPYWQAVGHSQPQTTASCTETSLPRNKPPEDVLHLCRSFPIRSHHDGRGPLVVALNWNHGRICINDRANKKVKFFDPYGNLLNERELQKYTLYDIAFINEVQGRLMYLAPCPKDLLMLFISIDDLNNITIVKRLQTEYYYTCVCRGPQSQTYVGTEVYVNDLQNRPPSVHVFNFLGQVLTRITHTPSSKPFMYPKAVEVFGSNIIVLDWKLHSVSVFYQDGTPVGEYQGSPENQLIDPLHITLDQMGNIMILNGKLPNVHVIDLHCNLLNVIKIPATSKLIAYDIATQRLCLARSNCEIEVFSFDEGYDALNHRNLLPNSLISDPPPMPLETNDDSYVSLPTVAGMLPSTILSIAMRGSRINEN